MTHIIILAAGKGTRMKSDLPKVLHPVNGVPIIERLLENISPIDKKPTIIVGHQADKLKAATGNHYHYIEQTEQKGTGHAIMAARESLKDSVKGTVIILPGDHPLVSPFTLQELQELHESSGAVVTLATAQIPNFEGEYVHFLNYGRIIRGTDGFVDRIVEYKDANQDERATPEVNLSYYCFDAEWLWQNIKLLTDNNAAKEYYLTDMVKIAKDQGRIVAAYPLKKMAETLGINTPEQLAQVERALVQ